MPPPAAAAAPGAPPADAPPAARVSLDAAPTGARPRAVSPAAASAAAPRLLVIAIEAVPFDAIARWADPARTDPPLFAGLTGPAPLVSTFPSSTSLAFTGMLAPLGVPPAPGYEVRYFDRGAGRVRGGGARDVRRSPFGWKAVFAFEIRSLPRKALGYGWPHSHTPREIDDLLAAFRASADDPFFGYLTLPDALAHRDGPDGLLAALRHLDRGLAALRAGQPRPVRVVLFSDHGVGGGERLENVRPAVRAALRAAGLRPNGGLDRPGDLVLVPFGLLSSVVAFTRPGEERPAAAALAGARGVELCAHPAGEGRWVVVGAGGDGRLAEARIERRADGAYRYLPLAGDPLGYLPVAHALAGRGAGADPVLLATTGVAGSNGGVATAGGAVAAGAVAVAVGAGADGGWHPAESWLAATLDARYPDALRRIAAGFELVANPASVLCSLAPGHSYGSPWTELGARVSLGGLRWTHGALRRDDSLGFVMTDLPGWTPEARALAFDELVPALGLSRPAVRDARAPAGGPARPRPRTPAAARGGRGR